MTQLKQRSPEDRQWAFQLGDTLNQSQARAAIKERFGIALGSNTVYANFCQWHGRQNLWNHLDEMTEQDQPRLGRTHPSSLERIRDTAILLGYAQSDRRRDAKLTARVVSADVRDCRERRAAEKRRLDRHTSLELAIQELGVVTRAYPDLVAELHSWTAKFQTRHAPKRRLP